MGNIMRKRALSIAIGCFLALIGIAMAIAPLSAPAWIGIPITVSVGALVLFWIWDDRRGHRTRRLADDFSDGDSVEVDCRLCGQFNRVPAARLRDRPKCGRCKTRLMPGRRVVLCRTTPIEGVLNVELKALWSDEERLWSCLADHVAMKQSVDANRRQSLVN